ncbi:MAG: hypothetical protein O2890_14880 [Cyanobacteria bacterium]|nr:hypothetical protein [Cyanobacteriota bacterium]
MTSALDTFYSHAKWAYVERLSEHYLILVVEEDGTFHPTMATPDGPEGMLNFGAPSDTLEDAIATARQMAQEQYAHDSVMALSYANL